MTEDWPEAVREWDAEQWESVGNGNYVLKRADAAIAALKAEVERLQRLHANTWSSWREAEAEVERLKWMLDDLANEAASIGKSEHHYFPEAIEEVLADLAARWERERDGTA